MIYFSYELGPYRLNLELGIINLGLMMVDLMENVFELNSTYSFDVFELTPFEFARWDAFVAPVMTYNSGSQAQNFYVNVASSQASELQTVSEINDVAIVADLIDTSYDVSVVPAVSTLNLISVAREEDIFVAEVVSDDLTEVLVDFDAVSLDGSSQGDFDFAVPVDGGFISIFDMFDFG